MKYSIITPSYDQPVKARRCIESLLAQPHLDWELIFINDSPSVDYSQVRNLVSSDDRITYIENDQNRGSNFSRNKGLQKISQDVDYVIFLDDDDWLASDSLADLQILLQKHDFPDWLVSNRARSSGVPLTQIKKDLRNKSISYWWSYLIKKNITGDATHCISRKSLERDNPLFSKQVKNGEEWYFFSQISPRFIYEPINSSLTDGYSSEGLNQKMQTTYCQNTFLLWREKRNLKIFAYLLLRSVRCTQRKKL